MSPSFSGIKLATKSVTHSVLRRYFRSKLYHHHLGEQQSIGSVSPFWSSSYSVLHYRRSIPPVPLDPINFCAARAWHLKLHRVTSASGRLSSSSAFSEGLCATYSLLMELPYSCFFSGPAHFCQRLQMGLCCWPSISVFLEPTDAG